MGGLAGDAGMTNRSTGVAYGSNPTFSLNVRCWPRKAVIPSRSLEPGSDVLFASRRD